MSRLLRNLGRVEGRRRHGAEEVVPEVGDPVPCGQEQGSRGSRSFQGHRKRIRGELLPNRVVSGSSGTPCYSSLEWRT